MTSSITHHKNVLTEVVGKNLCVGCGICVPACPQNAISIKFDSGKGVYIPNVNFSKCKQCGICYQVCQKNFARFFEEKEALICKSHPFIEGCGNVLDSYVGYVNDEKERLSSASGGVLTELLKFMLKTCVIDGAVVVKPIDNTIDKPLFQPFLAKTIQELNTAKGSHYYPIEHSEILNLINVCEKIAVVGLPCLIVSLRRLIKIKGIQDKTIYMFTLACGGVRNANMVKHIIASRSKSKTQKNTAYAIKVSFRDKTGINRADEFNFTDGVEHFGFATSVYGELWYSDIYKLNGCNFCPDFSGYSSDLAVMDAWLDEYRSDPKGTSIVLSRNRKISGILSTMEEKGILTLLPIETGRVIEAQRPQIEKAEKRFYTWGVLKGVLDKKTKQYLRNHGRRVRVKYISELISYRIRMFLGFLLYDKLKLYHIHPLYLNLLTSPSRSLKGILRKIKKMRWLVET